ncbi:glycoside hydrolase family 1 protein [Penicillium malachiteum]|nr:glycoside hydrolase family 1 protein [Penicillium malachiteum]
MKLLLWAAVCASIQAQQVYVTVNGPDAEPLPTKLSLVFPYTLTETVRFATPASSSKPFPTYALPYKSVHQQFRNLKTTSWSSWQPDRTSTATDSADPYGQVAYSSLWEQAALSNLTRGSLSTTVSPTPVPTSSLILPPPLYFPPQNTFKFPENFILGVAGAAAQIEGAVADEGRGPALPELVDQVMDKFSVSLSSSSSSLLSEAIPASDEIANDFVANENYYLYKQDIERIAAMGVKHYSFSIPWTRILPFALPGSPVNSQGLQHYDDLIDFAISKGVQPMVTIFHMDTPLVFFGTDPLSTSGLLATSYYGTINMGFQNATFEDAYVHYGKIVMAHFADRVPIWVTFNEPDAGCISGPAIAHVNRAHARLYHYYKEELQGKGRVTMKLSAVPGVPQNPRNKTHIQAVEHYNNLNFGPFLNPLVLGEDYPEEFKMTIQDYVPLSKKDLRYLKGTMDIVSYDAYTVDTVYPVTVDYASCAGNNDTTTNTNYPSCVGITTDTVEGWAMGDHIDYIHYNTAKYLRTGLNWLWSKYGKPIAITEFGLPSSASAVEDLSLKSIQYDTIRSEYYLSYLSEVLDTIHHDGVNVMGVFAWSFADDWEWGTFEHNYGLQYVNRTSMERTYRRSFFDMVDFVESRREK